MESKIPKLLRNLETRGLRSQIEVLSSQGVTLNKYVKTYY